METLEEAGHETWAVGGVVRDTLLGIESGDWDLATRARPDQVLSLFKRTVPIGVEHGTVGVLTPSGDLIEVTTFRRDVETFGRRAVVEFSDRVEEDLARRDFTINAIAWHPLREELLDPFDGLDDLQAGILRAVGDADIRFAEDFLRVLRGLRFAGSFSLEIEPATWRALVQATGSLRDLSAERIREELMKILSAPGRPSASLELYREAGVLPELYPELAALVGEPGPHGSEEDLWAYSIAICDCVPAHRSTLRLAALLHGIGWPEDAKGTEPEDVSARAEHRAAALMIRLRYSNIETREVVGLVGVGIEPPSSSEAPADLRRLASRIGRSRLSSLYRLWIAAVRADRQASIDRSSEVASAWRAIRRELREGHPLSEEDLALDGKDLIAMGLKPGPRFGEILAHLLDRVLEDPTLNVPDTLLSEVAAYLEGDSGEGAPHPSDSRE